MSQLVGLCPNCFEIKQLSRHHIYPKRYFKRPFIVLLCRKCHNDIELIISNRERGKKLREDIYYNIVVSFLKTEE